MKVAVSFLKSNLNNIETIRKIIETDAEYIHLDLMDGIYVENKNFNKFSLKDILKEIYIPMQVHLMCVKPYKYLKYLKKYNVETIFFHLDALSKPLRTINEICKMNVNPGIVINPLDNIDMIDDYLPLVKDVLVMSVTPGAGGQEFISDTYDKIKKLDKIRKENKYEYKITVDGGINDKVIDKLKKLNVDIVVSGSFICLNENFQKQINKLR